MENCNRILREEQSQPTEPSWLQISPKSRVTLKDVGKEGFVTTRRHHGEQMTVCVTFTFKAQMVFAYTLEWEPLPNHMYFETDFKVFKMYFQYLNTIFLYFNPI